MTPEVPALVPLWARFWVSPLVQTVVFLKGGLNISLANKNMSLFSMFVCCGQSLTMLISALNYIGLGKPTPYEMNTN